MVLTFNESFDREALKRLLQKFSSATKRRRDKRLIEDLSDDLLSDIHPPRLQRRTVLRLAKWCKTDGIYGDAMIVAREISRLLFGEVLNRDLLGV
jgi:hypothetical protein